MKIAVVYNRDSQNVINLFGLPNREKYGKTAIKRIVDALKQFGHQVRDIEADKDFIDKLEKFMPRVLKNERPGMVFNLSYGIQGQARYTHVPGILEMVGIPYVGSGPLAHSLALDKVVAKMIFIQNGLPTPQFAVLNHTDKTLPDLQYPLIVKPKNESVSMGIRVVENEDDLREAARDIFENFHNQPVLVEHYIEGREINVGLIGNDPPEAFPPCEIVFGGTGPRIFTIEDKKGNSGRDIGHRCPADIGDELSRTARDLAVKAFSVLGCYDTARVDMRLDRDGKVYILELNSLPSLGEYGSYVAAAARVGLDFPKLINRLVETACTRYFGTPAPPLIHARETDPEKLVFSFLTQRRDLMEKRLEEWVHVSSRTSDPVGNNTAVARLDRTMHELKMQKADEFTDKRAVWTWETRQGFAGGTLFMGHFDVPLEQDMPVQAFHRDPEWLYGEGIGMSRAPLVMIEFALRALRYCRKLNNMPVGVLYYLDEGKDCRYSADIIRSAAARARRVFVLRPGSPGNHIRIQRRGIRKFHLVVESRPKRVGSQRKAPEALIWFNEKCALLSKLASRKNRISVAAVDVRTDAFRMFLPHRVQATILLSYLDHKLADQTEVEMGEVFGRNEIKWFLRKVSDRPPMKERRINLQLARALERVARVWDIPLEQESSLLPSIGGLVPATIPVVCGVGPLARDLYTPQESVQRVSLIQRTLLMAQYLAAHGGDAG